MTRRFLGIHPGKVDPKGRVSIPFKFRRVLEADDPDFPSTGKATLCIAHGHPDRPYLEGFSVQSLDELHNRIDALPSNHPHKNMLVDLYYSRVEEFSFDDAGRIVLPQNRRDMIGLVEDAVFVAKGNRFEIWPPAPYHARRAAPTDAYLAAQGDDFDPLSVIDAPFGGL